MGNFHNTNKTKKDLRKFPDYGNRLCHKLVICHFSVYKGAKVAWLLTNAVAIVTHYSGLMLDSTQKYLFFSVRKAFTLCSTHHISHVVVFNIMIMDNHLNHHNVSKPTFQIP